MIMHIVYNQLVNGLRRRIIDPFYYAVTGGCRSTFWKNLEHTQFLPEKNLRNIQWERLLKLLNFANCNNSYYHSVFQEASIEIDDIKHPDDLLKLPILTKELVRTNIDRLISDGFSKHSLLLNKTGGSTGKPLEIYITEECSEQRNACARRHDRWSGWDVGEPIAAVWGNPVVPTSLKSKLKQWLVSPIIYLDTMSVSRQSVENFADEWQRVKPTLLFGHAHSMYLLAKLVKEYGVSTIKPKGIISSSMMLLPHERKVIENTFGIKVTDRYGCEEVSLIASECEMHKGMHLNIEHLFIEFIKEDGTPAKPGEPGKIVVTDLMNYAMPLIRYQVEDIGVPSDRTCPCGRGLPLMESVSGRMADFLKKQDGTQVAGISLIENTLTRYPGIGQMQIIQKEYADFLIRLVPDAEYERGVQEELTKYLKEVFGEGITINFEICTNIPPEKTGKYRFSICMVE